MIELLHATIHPWSGIREFRVFDWFYIKKIDKITDVDFMWWPFSLCSSYKSYYSDSWPVKYYHWQRNISSIFLSDSEAYSSNSKKNFLGTCEVISLNDVWRSIFHLQYIM